MKKITIIVFLLTVIQSFAQQSELVLNYEEGKDRLLQENLYLLAEYYNLDLAEAEIQQASLWENPLFVWNAEMYSIAQNRYFAFNNQKLIQLEYSFSVSGRRINAIKSAKLEKEIAKLALSDVIRGLIYEYSQHYYTLLALREENEILENVYNQFQNVILLNEKKLELGTVSGIDLIRLKAENLALLTEINSNKNDLILVQSELHKMLNLNANISIKPQSIQEMKLTTSSVQQLISEAQLNRPDYAIAEKNMALYQINLKAQKSEAVPKINLGYQPLDGGSNYVRPYSGMVFEMAIPIFNRNQGKISAAKIQIDQSKYQLDYKRKELESEVTACHNQVLNSMDLFTSFNQDLFNQMNELSENAKINYEKRNITLLEYIDYQRAYIANQQNWIEVNKTYHLNISQLNFVIGKNTKI